MQSKLLVNVTDGCIPCITIVQPFINPDERSDLPDKILQMVFEGLELKSTFMKVDSTLINNNTNVRTITALSIIDAVNELERLISPDIQKLELIHAFKLIRESVI